MLNFTVGPVQICDEVLKIGAEPVPYFRTPEFSEVMLENERLMKKFMKASDDSRTVFITGSGTASMEAAVINMFKSNDKVLIVNGGGFGQRFCDICEIHKIPYTAIKLETGHALEKEQLLQYENCGYTGFLVNLHETSTGVYYDIKMISDFCHKNGLYLVVDSISSFIADPYNMSELGVDVTLTGSQKALAVPPGISIIVMNKRSADRIMNNDCGCMYLNLKDALVNGERGQTPYTPAVGTLLQINKRLKLIDENGFENETAKIAEIAADFRKRIKNYPFEIASECMSNAVTPLRTTNGTSAYRIFEILKDEYEIFICPNGGALRDKIFRVGHIGNLTIADNDKLFDAFDDLKRRKNI